MVTLNGNERKMNLDEFKTRRRAKLKVKKKSLFA